MAEWVHRATGVKYDKKYWNDPEYRGQQEMSIQKWLVEAFPEYFSEIKDLDFPIYNIGIGQAYIIICALFGGEIRYFDNYNPDIASPPLKDVNDLNIKVPDIENTWPIDLYLEQYSKLVKKYGEERVNFLPFVGEVKIPRYGKFIQGWVHSPLTTAYKLRGEQIFMDMIENPALAYQIIEAVVETERRLLDLVARVEGATIDLVYIPACVSSWISPKIFREWDIPAMKKLIVNYNAKGGVHCCGPSTHVLDELRKLPELVVLELGEGTDMTKARRVWPKALIRYILDTYQLIRSSAQGIEKKVIKVIQEADAGPLTIQLPVEWGTSPEILKSVYKIVRNHNKVKHGTDKVQIDIQNMGIHTR